MTILCISDFSPAAQEAAAAAAAIATRVGDRLLLAHASGLMAGAPSDALQKRLAAEAARLAGPGLQVATALLEGAPVGALLSCIEGTQPALVVAAVSSEGRRKLGGVAASIGQGASRPLLLVRSAAPFREWTSGARPLRVFLADDFSTFTEPAFRFLKWLRAAGPCEVTVAHLYSPVAEHARAGLLGAGEPAQVEKRIEEDLAARLRTIGESGARTRVAASYGRVADPLVALASEEQADLLVLGTHQRRRLERAWHGSVSHLALQLAPMSVASVPFGEESEAGPVAVPEVRRVLACTDFSRLGDAVVGHAFSVLPSGGEVVLLHVIHVWPPLPPGTSAEETARLVTAEERATALRRLQALIPADAAARGVAVRTELTAGSRVAALICQLAERESVDLICISSHGRSGITRAVLGSVAAGVVAKSRRPVLVVRPRTG